MLAVLTGIRTWLPSLERHHVHVYIDNTAVLWGLVKASIRGQAMTPLWAIIMLMARLSKYKVKSSLIVYILREERLIIYTNMHDQLTSQPPGLMPS